MKIKVFLPLLVVFNGFIAYSFCQVNNVVVRAWGVEETMMGGAPPPEMEKPINRTSRRFFLETKPDTKVKIIAVWIGKIPFQVVEEPYSQDASKDIKLPNSTLTKNNFIQVLVTDTLKTSYGKTAPSQLQGNAAVIVFSKEGKKYFEPIKTIQHTQLNLP